MFQAHKGGVPQSNNEIKGISFITDFTILFQSPLFTRAAKGPEIQADLTSYHLTPSPFFFPVSSPFLWMCFPTASHGNHQVFRNLPLYSVKLLYSARLALNWMLSFAFIFLIPVCPCQVSLNGICFHWHAPHRALLSSSSSHISTFYLCTALDFWLDFSVILARNNSISTF